MKGLKVARLGTSVLIVMLLLGAVGCVHGAATATEAVHFSTLIPFLPGAPSGWEEEEEPHGMMYTTQEGTWSMATKSYTKSGTEDITADVMITDYAFYTTGWSAAWKGLYAWETTEGYAKTTKVKGFPAWEVYTKATNDYSLYVGINDRFMVFTHTNSDKDTLYKLANSIDYSGIAALGGAAPSAGQEQTAPPLTPRPTQKEEGKAPGFEALAAVAGVGAVAYLLVSKKRSP